MTNRVTKWGRTSKAKVLIKTRQCAGTTAVRHVSSTEAARPETNVNMVDFGAEPLRMVRADSQRHDSDIPSQSRLTDQKPDLQARSQRYGRGGPNSGTESRSKGARMRLWLFWKKRALKPS